MLVTLGLFAFAGYEFNLTTVAGFLTLIGYSVNDTVVTFDRVRENMRKRRGGEMIDADEHEHQPDALAHDPDRQHDHRRVAHALCSSAATRSAASPSS